ncbi:MAG: PD40 domain-containing protein [Rudaea sp.]|uniref:PD40 domain-containing protein n=1 Tax=unclassified Rudaea TaxID=2627037 RepID=UPI0010FA0113|nr:MULTISPECIES: PD40 domain-containing protein [unclassified Rudaea]MBN8888214.1 PD40 domain-containing protein [Rudaea sp.]MBR0344452.1 PD40 domain-containing protein [Rudaea sp.]
MRTTYPSLAAILLAACLSGGYAATPAPPYAAPGPLREPTIFGAGVISAGDHESHIAFTPDGKEAYFVKNAPGFDFWTIFVSTWRDGHWTEPKLASFASGQYNDADPFITADGKHVGLRTSHRCRVG